MGRQYIQRDVIDNWYVSLRNRRRERWTLDVYTQIWIDENPLGYIAGWNYQNGHQID